MALGISAGDSGISHQDDAEQLRVVREISALYLQFHGRKSLSLDEGVLPGRFRSLEVLRFTGSLVSRRFIDGRRRRELAERGIDYSSDSLRQQLVSQRVRHRQR